jgi:hypothetical protein
MNRYGNFAQLAIVSARDEKYVKTFLQIAPRFFLKTAEKIRPGNPGKF